MQPLNIFYLNRNIAPLGSLDSPYRLRRGAGQARVALSIRIWRGINACGEISAGSLNSEWNWFDETETTASPVTVTGKAKAMYEKFGWNHDNMFLLTRDYPLEDITEADELLYYGNQVYLSNDSIPDRFGRNLLDREFIALCIELHVLVVCEKADFKSLTCRKVVDQFMMRVQFNDEDYEMELTEMVAFFVERHEKRLAAKSRVS